MVSTSYSMCYRQQQAAESSTVEQSVRPMENGSKHRWVERHVMGDVTARCCAEERLSEDCANLSYESHKARVLHIASITRCHRSAGGSPGYAELRGKRVCHIRSSLLTKRRDAKSDALTAGSTAVAARSMSVVSLLTCKPSSSVHLA